MTDATLRNDRQVALEIQFVPVDHLRWQIVGFGIEVDFKRICHAETALADRSDIFAGRFGRADFESKKDLLDGAGARAYVHERNFERLDRVEELARERGCTVPQMALAYVLADPMNVYPIVGAANREELVANDAALSIEISAAERAWLNLETDSRE